MDLVEIKTEDRTRFKEERIKFASNHSIKKIVIGLCFNCGLGRSVAVSDCLVFGYENLSGRKDIGDELITLYYLILVICKYINSVNVNIPNRAGAQKINSCERQQKV